MPKQEHTVDKPQYPTQREKVDELTKKMETGIQDFMQSEKYMTFLRTMSKFHNYSFRNCVLIAMQKPDASMVAGYQAWQQKFERQVERGAKGIKILAPSPYEVTVEKNKLDANGKPVYSPDGQPVLEKVKEKRLAFRAVTVFDVSQTTGKPLPQIGAELDGSVTDYDYLLQAIRDVSDAPITIEPIESTAKGYYDRSDHTIHVKEGMSEAQTVKTALHELTHSVLHNVDADDADKKSRQTKECEAESVAFVVCDHFGLDTSDYSFPYLASWSSAADLPEIHDSLATIQQTADELITKISTRFQELKLGQRQESEAAEQSQVSDSHSAEAEKSISGTRDDIIGNTPFREIPDKTYIRVSKDELSELLAGLDQQGISYSGKLDRNTGGATITISKSDQERVRELLDKASTSSIGEQPPRTNSQIQIIGNTPYREIPEKSYVKLDAAVTDSVVKQLETLNIPYTGKLDPIRGNIITVSREHKKLVEELSASAKETLSDTPSKSRYARCTRDELEMLKDTGLQVDAQTKGEQAIIRFSEADADKIKQVLSLPTTIQKR